MSKGRLVLVRVEATASSPAAYCVEVTFDPDRMPLTIAEGAGRPISDELRAACDALIDRALDEDN